MAEDVEVMSVNEEAEEDGEDGVNRRVLSTSSDITSSNSAIQPAQNAASNGDAQTSDMVSSISDTYNGIESDRDQPCDCSSSSSSLTPGGTRGPGGATRGQTRCSQSDCDAGGRYGHLNQSDVGCCPSDTESEIVVDDSPPSTSGGVDGIGSSNDNGADDALEVIAQDCDNGSTSYIRPLGRSRSVTPSPSYIRLATPSTPGTPRLRSGSVSGTTYAPMSPRPSTRGTPAERPRAGSVGEIEMKDRAQGRVKIIDGLDILQLPRPRNPGGILPLNGHDNFNSSNEALNLIMEDKPQSGKQSDHHLPSTRTFSSFNPVESAAGSSKQSNTSYLISNIIKTTPNRLKPATVTTFGGSSGQRQGCAINESVERPKPSSEVDSEGVAKKIARLNSTGFLSSSTSESLWGSSGSSNLSGNPNQLSGIRVLSDKTPPERPKPPRRTVLSPADNGTVDMSNDRFVSSSVRRRLSPTHPHSLSRGHLSSTNGSGEELDVRGVVDSHLQHYYKCRLCNFSTSNHNLLQLHTAKHGGGSKTFRCSLCDYTTTEKTNFRRHRRLHHKSSPVNMLKCVKCSYSTPLPRKLRDHYQQAHPDLPASTLLPGLTSGGALSPPPFMGTHCLQTDMSGGYHGQFYDNPLLLNRTDRLGFQYTLTGRHPSLNMPLDQYTVPYGGIRDRQGDSLTSNFLRSIVTSIVSSDASSRQAAATSTVTSSNYLLPTGADNSNNIQDIHSCTNQTACTCQHNVSPAGIKIKVETDLDNTSDVSSCNRGTPSDISRDLNDTGASGHAESASSGMVLPTPGRVNSTVTGHGIRRHRSDDVLAGNNILHDLPTDLSSPRKQRAISDINHSLSSTSRIHIDGSEMENGVDDHSGNVYNGNIMSVSDTIVKSDSTTRGIQCVLPVIKTELDLDGDYYDFCRRPRFVGVDRAVQCSLTSSAASNRSQTLQNSRTTYRSQSASESDHSEQHSISMDSRCEHCGISFDDEVIFSIHIGCHSHTDPFKCNVCGKQCGNKYGFYSHIMRGHQF